MRPNDPEHHIRFDMTWYSFVFPNTALVTATLAIAKTFASNAIKIFGTIFAGMLVVVWIFVFVMMIRSFYLRRMVWPESVDGSEMLKNRWERKGVDADEVARD